LGTSAHGTVNLFLQPLLLSEPPGFGSPGGLSLSRVASWLGLCILAAGCLPAANLSTPTPPPPPPSPTSTIPFPTAAPTITETPPPTLTATPDIRQSFGTLVYNTEFDAGQGWQVGQDVFGVTSLDEGELSVVVNQPQAARTVMSPIEPIGDFYAEVILNTAICQSDDEYGIVFRVNPLDEQYRFTITCDGGIRLRRVLVGSSRAVVPFEPSNGAVMPHAPATNTLAILARGPDLELFVNGVSVLQAHDVALPVGKVGLIVISGEAGQTTVSFDRFSVWNLLPAISAPDSTTETPDG
jgi:hypothetical protein